jgi:hypothetical protein
LIGEKGGGDLGLQIYCSGVKDREQILKPFSDNRETVIEYIRFLKKEGYEIIDYPPIENTRRVFNTTLKVLVPLDEILIKKEKE